MLYIRLFHGRENIDEPLDDWGEDGPVFGPYRYIHTTYAHHVKMGHNSNDVDDLQLAGDMIYYDGMYYGDWSIFPEEIMEERLRGMLQVYDCKKAKLPIIQPGKSGPVRFIVYIRGGLCQDVVTNLPESSWVYSLVDYDNEPGLPDNFNPFTPEEMQMLPDVKSVFDAAQRVIDNWETNKLADAVRDLEKVLNPVP